MSASSDRGGATSPGGGSKPTRVRLAAVDRRAQIVAAARETFLRSGLAGARTREISEAAGVNEALLYRHFDSKEDLFDAAIIEPLEALVDDLLGYRVDAEAYAVSASLRRERVATLLDTLLSGVLEFGPLLGVLLLADPERASELYRTRILLAVDAFADAIDAIDDLWDHRAFDARVVAISAIGACVALVLDGGFGGKLLDDREGVVGELTDNILYGLEARPESVPPS